MSQRANEPGGEKARGERARGESARWQKARRRKSQEAKEPSGERARGRNGKEAKKPNTHTNTQTKRFNYKNNLCLHLQRYLEVLRDCILLAKVQKDGLCI